MMGRYTASLSGNAGTYLPELAATARRLPAVILLRILESLLLAAGYSLLFPVLENLFAGTLTPRLIIETTAGMLACHLGRVVLFHVSAMGIYSAIYVQTGAMRLRLASHVRSLPLGAFRTSRLDALRSIMTDDLQQGGKYASSLVGFLVTAATLPLFLTLTVACVDWRLAVAMIASTVLGWPVLMILNRFVSRHGQHHLSSISDASDRLIEYVLGIKVLKSYGVTGRHFGQLSNSLAEVRDHALVLELGSIVLLVGATVLVELGFPALILYAMYGSLGGSFSIATAMFALILAVRFYAPIQDALGLSTEFIYLGKVADRVADIINVSPQVSRGTVTATVGNDIVFDSVSFAYKSDDEKPVLENFSLKMNEGTVTALVGPSGAGKTTVANLVARFWDVDQGSLHIGGVDVRDLKLDELMARISIVFQDVTLFNDSILENIRVGRPEASDEEVFAAAKQAYCHGFVSSLPQGYQTLVGEGGSRLSGGEKQRISVARALLKDAPIILLDEATASVDASAEREMQAAFKALAANKTVVVIAHKLSTIIHADQIVVMQDGQIVQNGRHENLVASNGLYQQLWNAQATACEWQVA